MIDAPWALTRRAFLERSLLATAAVALPGVLLPACRTAYESDVPAGVRLRVLEPWEYAVLRATTARIIAGAEPGPSADETVQRADAALVGVEDPAVRDGLRLVLRVIEYGTPLRGYARPFTALAPADQDVVLQGLASSRFETARVAFGTVKLFAFFFYYTAPATWPALGYDGPWVGRIPLPAYRVEFGTRNGTPFASGSRPPSA